MATSLPASAILSAIAPQFDASVGRATFIELAASQTSTVYYGGKYEYAVALRAAHLLTLQSSEGTAAGGVTSGDVESIRQGDISVSYASSSGASSALSADLSRTSYGRTLLGLSRGAQTSISTTAIL